MRNDQFLRNSLKANAMFSALSGISLIFFSGPISRMMNLNNHYILMGIGAGLLLFVITIWLAFKKAELNLKEVKMIIIQDWAWVLGSVILLIWRPVEFTLVGMDIIIAVAIIVATFAILQTRGIKLLNQ